MVKLDGALITLRFAVLLLDVLLLEFVCIWVVKIRLVADLSKFNWVGLVIISFGADDACDDCVGPLLTLQLLVVDDNEVPFLVVGVAVTTLVVVAVVLVDCCELPLLTVNEVKVVKLGMVVAWLLDAGCGVVDVVRIIFFVLTILICPFSFDSNFIVGVWPVGDAKLNIGVARNCVVVVVNVCGGFSCDDGDWVMKQRTLFVCKIIV